MARLLVHVEGSTEEFFVNEVLRGHLVSKGFHSVEARIVGNPRHRGRGGICSWPRAKNEIVNHLREDPGCIATTMVDYYALPQGEANAWPGRAEAIKRNSVREKAQCVHDALRTDLAVTMGHTFNPNRFVPFIVMHEFEGLLFSDCAAFSRGIGRSDLQASLQSVREQFATPEDINDSPLTAPSKRVSALVPKYQKPLLGVLAILEIGLERICEECLVFDDWIKQLESMAS